LLAVFHREWCSRELISDLSRASRPDSMPHRTALWPETLWRRYGRPAVKAAKIQKRVGFHTFRHTYTTLLTQNNEEVKVVQELLRHANRRITLDLDAQAGMLNKRLAQSKLVRMVLNKGEALA
jgi:integrase